MPKKLYILTTVPSGRRSGGWSGLCSYLTEGIKTLYQNTEVIICPDKPISKWNTLFHYLKKLIDGYGLVVTRDIKYSRQIARYIEKQITSDNFEILSFGTPLVAELNKKNNVTILTDAFAENLKMAFNNISPSETNRLHEIDRKALDNSKRLVIFNGVTKETAVSIYNYPEDKICKLNSFPYFDYIPAVTIKDIDKPKYKLLFISMDWKRRNGDFAISLFKALLLHYRNLQLHVSGQRPPRDVLGIDGVVYHDINKDKPEGQQNLFNLYQMCDLLISPGQYNLGSAAVLEAGLFGIPTIARSGGGINDNIKDDVSGLLLPEDSIVQDWKRVIENLYSNINYFNRLRKGAKEFAAGSADVLDRARAILDFMEL